MIGSDWPVCTVAGKYDKVMYLVIDYLNQYTESEKRKVLGLNCQRIYKITN
jgi:L-fuconolactonase